MRRLRLEFVSLRSRLLAAFLLIIVVALLSAGSAAVWLIQDYQRRLAVDHLSEVAVAASLVSRQLEARDARPDDIGAILANQLTPTKLGPVRVLLVDNQGRVVAERPPATGPLEPTFVGRRLDIQDAGPPDERAGRVRFRRGRASVWTETLDSPGRPYLFLTSRELGPPRSEAVDRFLSRQPAYRVVLAVPEHNIASAWRELAPSLAAASLVAIAASVATALWLSRSITHPLRNITVAAQAIARGDLRQSIPVRGRDEVAALAVSFNSMSRELERSHRALREFLANASHELRTPLTSIQGFSQALVDGALPGPAGAREAGQIINEEADRMRRLVEDLLYLSRVEAQEVTAARAPVDVAALLRETGRRLYLVAEQRGLRVTFDLPDLPAVPGDADQLDRLFGNLLDNAGKYTPPGHAVTVRARAGAGRVEVTVENTGSVIPAEDLPRIFDRFYRVEKSRARDVEGSGLGLAIAREVAEQHGGSIVATTDGVATTRFTVTLPTTTTPPVPDAGGRRGERFARATPAAAG